MRITTITFSLMRTMPMFPITHDPADEYANVKPEASCTIEFDADDNTQYNEQNAKHLKEIVSEAFNVAGEQVFEQIAEFSKEFRELYATPKKSSRSK